LIVFNNSRASQPERYRPLVVSSPTLVPAEF
jgi:hypothetical protein